MAEVIEDISDTFKRKSDEIKRKFAPEEPPPVIKPVSMAEKLAKLKEAERERGQKNKSKSKKKKKSKKDKGQIEVVVVDNVKSEFEVEFDDEKQAEKCEEQNDGQKEQFPDSSCDEFKDFNELEVIDIGDDIEQNIKGNADKMKMLKQKEKDMGAGSDPSDDEKVNEDAQLSNAEMAGDDE